MALGRSVVPPLGNPYLEIRKSHHVSTVSLARCGCQNVRMSAKNDYDEPIPYDHLPIYVYPEGEQWVATAIGYDHAQRAAGPQLAANSLVRDLRDWGLINLDTQKAVMYKLKSPKDLAEIWNRERENDRPARIAKDIAKR
jgi:hypothetical protein